MCVCVVFLSVCMQSGGESVDEHHSRPVSPTSGMYDTGVYVCMCVL
jgi:hypothetical protein